MISLCGSESGFKAEGSESVKKAEELSEGVEQPDKSEIVPEQAEESAEQENLWSTSTVTIQDTGMQIESSSSCDTNQWKSKADMKLQLNCHNKDLAFHSIFYQPLSLDCCWNGWSNGQAAL